MFAKLGLRSFVRRMFVLGACGLSCSMAMASDFLLTDGRAFPGQLWQSRDGAAEQLLYRREATANPAFPRAAMKLAQVASGPDGKIYFASGLDGYVLHLLDRRHEVVSFEFAGQIRDLHSGNEAHTVYFSVVETPQNGAPLADGKIYRRDLWAGQPSEVATIHQSQIDGNWWGTFAIQNGTIYIATFENPSRIFKLTGAVPERVFAANRFGIQGFTATDDGQFYFVDGSDNVYRTSDFDAVGTVLHGGRSWTDVAIELPATTR